MTSVCRDVNRVGQLTCQIQNFFRGTVRRFKWDEECCMYSLYCCRSALSLGGGYKIVRLNVDVRA